MNTFTTSTMKAVSMIVLAGGVFLGGMTDAAQAGDKKIYSAAYCKPQQGKQAGKYARYSGNIWNYDRRQALIVECPVIRDNTTNRNGLKAWGFAARNSKSAHRLTCTMISKDYKTGKVLASKRTQISASSKPATRPVNVSSGPKKSLSKGMSYYVLNCSIPPVNAKNNRASFLASYYVDEP